MTGTQDCDHYPESPCYQKILAARPIVRKRRDKEYIDHELHRIHLQFTGLLSNQDPFFCR